MGSELDPSHCCICGVVMIDGNDTSSPLGSHSPSAGTTGIRKGLEKPDTDALGIVKSDSMPMVSEH